MNPLTNVKNITKLGETELKLGIAGSTASWHNQYKDSAWIFVGGLPYDLSEGDIICVFSQYGEVVHLNLVRDRVTGKSKGFCFLCYEDQRSTILAVDNLNGIKLVGRTIRVDHVAEYKVPKDPDRLDEDIKDVVYEGVAPGTKAASAAFRPYGGGSEPRKREGESKTRESETVKEETRSRKSKKEKKEKKKKKEKKRKSRRSSSPSDSNSSTSSPSDDNRKRKRSPEKNEKKRKSRRSSSPPDSDSSSSSSRDDNRNRKRSPERRRSERRDDDKRSKSDRHGRR